MNYARLTAGTSLLIIVLLAAILVVLLTQPSPQDVLNAQKQVAAEQVRLMHDLVNLLGTATR